MSITKQLYVRFGAILGTVLLLCIVILVAVEREHSAKSAASQALEMAELTNQVRFQMMQNRLYLSNYLLSGDSREVDRMNDGIKRLGEYLARSQKLSSDQQHAALDKVANNESSWATEFAQPMLEKRREVDAGNATVADLQIYYLQKDASSWVKNSTDYLDQADQITKDVVEKRRKDDESAGTEIILIATLATLAAIGFGIVVAFKTARSITLPLGGV